MEFRKKGLNFYQVISTMVSRNQIKSRNLKEKLGGNKRMGLKIQSVFEKEFKKYGRVIQGGTFEGMLKSLKATPAPFDGVIYVASDTVLEADPGAAYLSEHCYGGMPIQIGYCNGTNTRLNCLEYHRDSEINIAADDVILLLAPLAEVNDRTLDTSKVEAFLVPKGTAVELYMTSLHYAPCSAKNKKPFRVMIVLPRGTNVGKPEITIEEPEDELLFATNKWLLAHPDTNEAEQGAYIGLTGENLDIKDLIE